MGHKCSDSRQPCIVSYNVTNAVDNDTDNTYTSIYEGVVDKRELPRARVTMSKTEQRAECDVYCNRTYKNTDWPHDHHGNLG